MNRGSETLKFIDLYQRMVRASLDGHEKEAGEDILLEGGDPYQLDCLLHPEAHPPVWRVGSCQCSPGQSAPCIDNCIFDAIVRDEKGNISIDGSKCVGCEECIRRCEEKRLTASKDILPALAAVRTGDAPVYAMIAPAFVSQFAPEVTPGKLRSAFKQLGFKGMVEVAVFADILTLKEALEFDRNINDETDFQLTSCCCPMWIAMIRRIYHQLIPHVPAAVSPMIACARTIKTLYPEAKTVFIGPCIAKKSEAKEPDLAGDVDYVLTFQEVRDIFDFARIDPAQLPEDERDHSSRAGRIYARAGGVSEAVTETVRRLYPHRAIAVRAQKADGVPACKKMINDLLEEKTDANFFEGMGCIGGCVGGPKALIDREAGRENVNQYGDQATYPTPIDNPYVIELLQRLGFDTVEALLEKSDIFTRRF